MHEPCLAIVQLELLVSHTGNVISPYLTIASPIRCCKDAHTQK